jgi:hypothetical protein
LLVWSGVFFVTILIPLVLAIAFVIVSRANIEFLSWLRKTGGSRTKRTPRKRCASTVAAPFGRPERFVTQLTSGRWKSSRSEAAGWKSAKGRISSSRLSRPCRIFRRRNSGTC